jgi:hypothetical protein
VRLDSLLVQGEETLRVVADCTLRRRGGGEIGLSVLNFRLLLEELAITIRQRLLRLLIKKARFVGSGQLYGFDKGGY